MQISSWFRLCKNKERNYNQPVRKFPSSIFCSQGNAEYIISDADACKLRQKNLQHPRIKRSLATIHAISEIRQRLHPVADVPLSVFKSPPFITELVKHYNSTFLSGNIDLKLDRRNLWRIFFPPQIQKGINIFTRGSICFPQSNLHSKKV